MCLNEDIQDKAVIVSLHLLCMVIFATYLTTQDCLAFTLVKCLLQHKNKRDASGVSCSSLCGFRSC